MSDLQGTARGATAPQRAGGAEAVARPEETNAGSTASAAADPRRSARRGRLRSILATYRLRIVGWFFVLFAIGTALTVVAVEQLLLRGVDDDIRRGLVQESDEFRSLASGNDPVTGSPFGPDVARIFDVFLDRNIPNRYEAFLTFLDGHLYRESSIEPPFALDQDVAFLQRLAAVTAVENGRQQTEAGSVDYLAVPIRIDGQMRGVFAVASFRDFELARHADVPLAALSVGLILLVIGSVLGWRLADRVLKPVIETASTARAISESDLTQRVEVRGDDELADLARTFNDMLDRLETAFDDQRRFLDDVGHELRTPLTIVRGHVELMDEGAPGEHAATRELVIDELDRTTRLVNDLIVLAQANRPDFLRRDDIDTGELLRRVHRKASVLGDRTWRLEIARSGVITCDQQRITQAMLELATNAVTHTRDGDEIRIGTDADDREARFWVADSGPGIPQAEQAMIFRRFYRAGGQKRASGRGLGLSIVDAIATAHGGRVDVASKPGSGAIFTIVVPLAGQ